MKRFDSELVMLDSPIMMELFNIMKSVLAKDATLYIPRI